MKILFDHECQNCGLVFEEFVEREATASVECPGCRAYDGVQRLITGGRIDPKLGVRSDHFPTMGDRWARIRYQHRKIEEKRR